MRRASQGASSPAERGGAAVGWGRGGGRAGRLFLGAGEGGAGAGAVLVFSGSAARAGADALQSATDEVRPVVDAQIRPQLADPRIELGLGLGRRRMRTT